MKDSNRIAICLITDKSDNMLMGLRKEGWCNPAGKIHEDEDPYVGAQRELKEETGLDAESIELVKVEFNKEKSMMFYLFKIEVDKNQEIDFSKDPDSEFTAVEYKDPNEIKDSLHIPVEDNIALKYWISH